MRSLESCVLDYSGMNLDEVRVIDVFVGQWEGEPVFMHTILVGDPDKPCLVLMHGYA